MRFIVGWWKNLKKKTWTCGNKPSEKIEIQGYVENPGPRNNRLRNTWCSVGSHDSPWPIRIPKQSPSALSFKPVGFGQWIPAATDLTLNSFLEPWTSDNLYLCELHGAIHAKKKRPESEICGWDRDRGLEPRTKNNHFLESSLLCYYINKLLHWINKPSILIHKPMYIYIYI